METGIEPEAVERLAPMVADLCPAWAPSRAGLVHADLRLEAADEVVHALPLAVAALELTEIAGFVDRR